MLIPSEFIFGGTGTSEGIPRLSCLIKSKLNNDICKVCTNSMEIGSKNRRRNTSGFIRYNYNNNIKVIGIDISF